MKEIICRDEVEAIAGSPTEYPILPLLLVILNEFHRQNISYCYWKSSRRVHLVLAGEGDLDLLVAREDQHRVQSILLQRGCKLFPSVAGRDHPSILSFLGYDEPSGRLIHLHLHLRLVVGERLLKNYHIPWEDAVLARSVRHNAFPIRILDPVSEALLLVIRSCLELRRLDPITLRNWAATTHKFMLDREALATRVDPGMLHDSATELIGKDVADTLVKAFYGEQALEDQARLRRRVQKHFAAYRSYNAVEFRLRSVGRAILWLWGGLNKRFLHLPRPWSRRAPGGGCVVAMIGIDGSGKSTAVAAMRAWLGTEIDTMPIYFGTGDGRPSLLLWPLKLIVPALTRALKTKPRGASHGKVTAQAPGLVYGGLLTVWALVVAREKRIKLVAARRAASRGLVVLADRYPQDEILGFNDGPLLTRLTGAPPWLRRFEASAYALARRLPPDLVIKLRVLPETGARREPDMDRAVIVDRVAAMDRLTFAGARVVCVDAEQPLTDVIGEVKHEIWRQL